MRNLETSDHAQRTRRRMDGGRWLALIPVASALVLGALMLPHAVEPEEVPLPRVDARALAHQVEHDEQLAERARAERLSPNVRALGSAIREFNRRSADEPDAHELSAARRAIDEVLPIAHAAGGVDGLLGLRAAQLRGFLLAVRRFEETGQGDRELEELGGTFLRRMNAGGWVRGGRTIALSDFERRVAFKVMWNGLLGLEHAPEFAPSLDEQRILYAFHLAHPHVPEAMRGALEEARVQAKDEAACAAVRASELAAVEGWRLDKVNKLAAIDPEYPAAYARGILLYRRGQYSAATQSFTEWLATHRDGPYALRARNYLRAALRAEAIY